MRTTVIAAAATAALGLAVTGVVTMTSASAAPGCPSVQVVGVPGTGYHLSYDQQGRPTNVDPNKPDVMLSQVAQYLRPDRDRGTIGYEQVPVPADIGFVLSYRESTRLGALAAKTKIAELAARCPGSSFAIIGYSQGAGVAGDVLSDIGQGRGPIPADRVRTGVLFADPRRTASDQLVGPHVPGIGVDDPRPGGFGALQGKTSTFCAAGDLVCDNDPNATVLRPIVRHYAGTANVSLLGEAFRALRENLIDPAKWAAYFETSDPIALAFKVATTVQQVDSYNRLGNHGYYGDLRLNIGGRTATQWAADRIRDSSV